MGLINQSNLSYYNGDNKGSYQFTSLSNIIDYFMIIYVGDGKLIPQARRLDVSFFAQRGLQELSFDTFKSTKAQEIVLPPSLSMILPHDYVNYISLSVVASDGIKLTIHPTSSTSNPKSLKQDADGGYGFSSDGGVVYNNSSTTNNNFNSTDSGSSNEDTSNNFNEQSAGGRYGLSPENAQKNGVFFIDNEAGVIRFSSNLSGATIVLDYISDSLGTDIEMKVHKFAEEAMYKYISHAILSTKSNIPEYQIGRLKKEKFAEIRKAKLRLSSIKLREITQVLRGKSKQIKH
jgi:hypothetical protein